MEAGPRAVARTPPTGWTTRHSAAATSAGGPESVTEPVPLPTTCTAEPGGSCTASVPPPGGSATTTDVVAIVEPAAAAAAAAPSGTRVGTPGSTGAAGATLTVVGAGWVAAPATDAATAVVPAPAATAPLDASVRMPG